MKPFSPDNDYVTSILESVLDGFAAMDSQWRYTYLNSEAERLLQVKHGEVIGHTPWEIFPQFKETNAYTEIQLAMEEGKPRQWETYYSLWNRWFSVRSFPLPNGGLSLFFQDITQRKAEQEAFKTERDRLNFVVDNCGIGLWLNPLPLGTLVWNHHVKEHFHLPADAAAPDIDQFYAMLHPDDRDRVRLAVASAIENDELFDVEYRTLDAEAKAMKWIRAVGKSFYDAKGEATHFDGITIDITLQKSNEDQLRQREHQLRFVADNLSVLIAHTGADLRYKFVNKPYAERFGLLPQQVIGKLIPEVVGERAYAAFSQYVDQALAGEQVAYEVEVPYASGDSHFMRCSITPEFNADGQVVGFVAAIINITDRRRAELELARAHQFLQSSIDALSSHVAVLDERGNILTVNDAWRQFAHENSLTGPDFGVGRNYFEVCRPGWGDSSEGQKIIDGLGAVLNGRHDHFELEYLLQTLAVRRWFSMRVTRFKSENPVRVVVSHEDITQRKEAEAALIESDRRKDEFLSVLAHELRNPLAPVRNGLELLKLVERDSEDAQQTRAMMERQLSQMVRLIDDLMDVTRISQGKIVLRKEILQLSEVVRSALETSQPWIDAGQHHLSVDITSQPIYVEGDAMRLSQVLANLLNNAAKYTERGGTIRLIAYQEGSEVIMAVEDNGVGIPSNMHSPIFEMFTQVDGGLEKTQDGLGIGLNIVKRLIEMHGGRIDVHSEGHGRGSRFVIRIPAASPTEPRQSDIDKHEPQLPSSHRILIVDDNLDAAKSMAVLLDVMGHETQIAYDGVAAIEIATTYRPRLILMDIGMPKMNGYEAARQIRAQLNGTDVAIIALTGWGQEEDRRKSFEAGFDQHLVKPIDVNLLKKILAEL